mmetsp:Transcript_24753/g.70433  ORF Transcript_24753/g.70433 Transcript_24753/m.70433 type:complete len:205 (-) Transcript_24753:218-832(-)
MVSVATPIARVNGSPKDRTVVLVISGHRCDPSLCDKAAKSLLHELDEQLEVLRIRVHLGPSLLHVLLLQCSFVRDLMREELVIQIVRIHIQELRAELLVLADTEGAQALDEAIWHALHNVGAEHPRREDRSELEAPDNFGDLVGKRLAQARLGGRPLQRAAALGERRHRRHRYLGHPSCGIPRFNLLEQSLLQLHLLLSQALLA